jgi:glycosyltransferase involved in cell wall biosynthesis
MDALRALGGSKRVDGLIARGDSARDRKDWDTAASHYRDALDADGGLAHIWVQYGHALKETRRYDEAETAYRTALEIEDLADTHLQLGHLHKITGRRREAEEDYLRALERQPDLADARSELSRIGWSGARLRARLSKTGVVPANVDQTLIAFELSDLIDHLEHSRNPTGIQRVQLSLGAGFAQLFDDERVQFVYYDRPRSDFYEVTRQQVLDLIDLVDASHRDEQEHRTIVNRLRADIVQPPPFDFPSGCYLVNVGTSWGFLNYFLSIRESKRLSKIRYVPLVHDCIPLMFQEFCNPNLVRDFVNWFCHMVGHADLILTNSENTRKDIFKAADELGAKLPQTATIYLNGEYRDYGVDTNQERDRTTLSTLSVHNLDVDDFVLLVSTIEPRKNHMLALNAWSHMLKNRPADAVPRLVCVGSSGWMNEAFHQRLERDRVLRERVIVMQDVSDQVLESLYKRCLFTVFPSLYEGWGLPISEALAHGKVPLVSRISSHPEAGGDLAVYFDIGSESDFEVKLKSLIDDRDMRRRHEEKIAKASPLRPWREVAQEIILAIENQRNKSPAEVAHSEKNPPAIVCGRYYSFARNLALSLQMLEYSGDIYRAGTTWYVPESIGCWIRGLSADITFSLADEQEDNFLIYLHWMGSPNIDNVFTLSLLPGTWTKRVAAESGCERWDVIPVHFTPTSKRNIRIRVTAERIDDFAKVTEGRDSRLSSAGIKGVYICSPSDSIQRIALIEAIQFGDLSPVARRFPICSVL